MSEPEDFEPELLTAVRRLLAERGPMTEAALAEALGDDDADAFGDELSAAADDSLGWLADGRWADALSLLEGRVVTHRLAADEVAHEVLHVEPDLSLVRALPDAARHLPSGEPLDVVFRDLPEPGVREVPDEALASGGSFVLPVGTLAAFDARPGDLVSLAIAADRVEVRPIDPAELGDPELVRQTLAGLLEAEGPSFVEPTLLAVCAEAPAAFRRPVPPILEVIEAAGLAYERDYLAPAGFDLAAHLDEAARRSLAEDHDLSEAEAHATMVLIQHPRRSGERAPEELAAAVPLLARPAVADAVLRSTLFGRREAAEDLLGLVDAVAPRAGHPVRPALQWLRARAYEWRGDVLEAEEALLAAERLDPDWPLTLLDLARYTSDRGDAVRGLALLRRADPWEDDDLAERLEHFQPVASPVVGRNDPCWCGSGRKFKQCHLHRPAEHPLAERASWLYAKAGRYADDAWWALMYDVAEQRSAWAEGDEAVEATLRDPLVLDAVLFEGGAFAEFLNVRGELLPADERLLGEQWLLVDRSVFEVTGVRRDEGVTLRDVRTGDVHEVQERTGSATLRPGHLVCARVVPAGDTMQILGGIEPVRLEERDELLALLDTEPEADELVAFLTRRFAPPTVVLGLT